MTARKTIRKVLRAGIVLSTLGLILSVLIQICGRFFLAASPPWTEEASRLFFIYTAAGYLPVRRFQHRQNADWCRQPGKYPLSIGEPGNTYGGDAGAGGVFVVASLARVTP